MEFMYWVVPIVFIITIAVATSSSARGTKTSIKDFENLGRTESRPVQRTTEIDSDNDPRGPRNSGSAAFKAWSPDYLEDLGEDDPEDAGFDDEPEVVFGSAYASNYLDRIPEAVSSGIVAFNGRGMQKIRGNWVGLYKAMGRPRGREIPTYAVFVPEETNPWDSNAVSIVVHGRHIAYVPSNLSSQVKRFVLANGGLVKVNIVLWFDPGRTKNTVRVYLAQPYRMKDNFKTDLKVRRWVSPRWGTQLVGFVN